MISELWWGSLIYWRLARYTRLYVGQRQNDSTVQNVGSRSDCGNCCSSFAHFGHHRQGNPTNIYSIDSSLQYPSLHSLRSFTNFSSLMIGNHYQEFHSQIFADMHLNCILKLCSEEILILSVVLLPFKLLRIIYLRREPILFENISWIL